MRWQRCENSPPTKNGTYWVYPYRTLSGYNVVTTHRFEDGRWEGAYPEQEFTHWKKIDIPEAPKGADKTFTDHGDNYAKQLIRDLKRN